MAYKINKDDCILCLACRAECPIQAIVMVNAAIMVVLPSCDGCGKCADVCPVEAIIPA